MTAPQTGLALPVITAIGSGKGGTGKTLLAVGLAQALAYAGERVLVCDADLGLSNAVLHLGLPSGGDMAGVLSGNAMVGDAAFAVMGGIEARGGFDLLAAPAGSGALADAGDYGARRLLAALRMATGYDRVLLDLGAGVEQMVLRFAAGADETLLVMTADPAALTDAYAFTKLLAQAVPGRTPSLLVNMAAGEHEARRTADALIASARAFLKLSPAYLGCVPRDAHALTAVRRQIPLMTLYPQSPAARAIETIAQRLRGDDGNIRRPRVASAS